MTTNIQNLTSTTRSAVCAAMAALIVTAGLVTGSVGADFAYRSAVEHGTSTLVAHDAVSAQRTSVG
jgi:hypothetical protein